LNRLEWDKGYLTNPDEQHIYTTVLSLDFPKSVSDFLSEESSWNPKFFAYGSFPLYLLKGVAEFVKYIEPNVLGYEYLYTLGRPISALFDTGTILLVFVSCYLLTKSKDWGLLAAFLYAIAVLPIQMAHFYTVDGQLTFWGMACITSLLWAIQSHHNRFLYLAAIFCGFAVATKITGLVLLVLIGVAIVFKSLTNLETGTLTFRWELVAHIIARCLFVAFLVGVVTIVLQPYMLIDTHQFTQDLELQLKMRTDAHIFPYTIQYLGSQPYWYPLRQMAWWGLGFMVTLLSLLGILYGLKESYREFFSVRRFQPILIIITAIAVFFIPTGSSAVKFMRYYLPLYPLLILCAVYLLAAYWGRLREWMQMSALIIIIVPMIIWTLMFVSIYQQTHPWVQASEWMHAEIPEGETIAVEHWDRSLPLYEVTRFDTITLGLYEPDTEQKLDLLAGQLDEAEYIVIATNRLYGSIPHWPEKYPATIPYYEKLFAEQLGFKKIAEFTRYPQLFGFSINDQSADESFTVYDHPRTIIFQKTDYNPQMILDLKEYLPLTR
ncbi:phospholipid carrier-dependent glycosyltransferase, partial [candidate division WWE3 bacterium]|nr:phospholipid carrier-dependent glycosyltransferase [candidate division WWE3 bacterium]